MIKWIKQLFCRHDFKPYSREYFNRHIEMWDPETESYVRKEYAEDGFIDTSICRCGKTKHESFK